jgi:hypothetical protein
LPPGKGIGTAAPEAGGSTAAKECREAGAKDGAKGAGKEEICVAAVKGAPGVEAAAKRGEAATKSEDAETAAEGAARPEEDAPGMVLACCSSPAGPRAASDWTFSAIRKEKRDGTLVHEP